MPSRKPSKGKRPDPTASVQEEQLQDVHYTAAPRLPPNLAPTGDNYEGYSDAAEILVREYNEFQEECGDYQFITVDEIMDPLKECVSPQDLYKLIDNEFTRGILIGQLLYHMERISQEEMDSIQESEANDDD